MGEIEMFQTLSLLTLSLICGGKNGIFFNVFKDLYVAVICKLKQQGVHNKKTLLPNRRGINNMRIIRGQLELK